MQSQFSSNVNLTNNDIAWPNMILLWHRRCSIQEGDSNPHSMDTSKIIGLGFPGFKSVPEMFDDCIMSFQKKGLL